jgi:hypothetical protein
LSRLQERFDEFTFTADGHAGKSLEPPSNRDFRFGVKPIRQETKLIGRNLSSNDTVEQMIEEAWRKTVPPDPRHG